MRTVAQHLAARLRREQDVERLGRRDEDVRRRAAHARRSLCGVSPVRTAARIGASPSIRAANSRPIPSSGARRFFSMSFDSALSGET